MLRRDHVICSSCLKATSLLGVGELIFSSWHFSDWDLVYFQLVIWMKPYGALPTLISYYDTVMISRMVLELGFTGRWSLTRMIPMSVEKQGRKPIHREYVFICRKDNEADSADSRRGEKDHMALIIQWPLTENVLYMGIVLAAWETNKPNSYDHAWEVNFTVRQTQEINKCIHPDSKCVKDILLSTQKVSISEMRSCNRRKSVRLEEIGKSKALLKKSSFKLIAVGRTT